MSPVTIAVMVFVSTLWILSNRLVYVCQLFSFFKMRGYDTLKVLLVNFFILLGIHCYITPICKLLHSVNDGR